MKVFQDYAYYYNMFYKDKEYGKEAEIVDQLIKKYKTCEAKEILNLGCGTGRHDVELSKLGYVVDGIDLSPNMIEIAKANNKNSVYEIADVRNYRSYKKYNVVVSLFHVISYQNDNQDVLDSFTTANAALNIGGLFVFDVWHGPGVLCDLPTNRIKRVENNEKYAIRYCTPYMNANTNIVNVTYDILIIDKKSSKSEYMKEEHHMRYFFTPEIKEYLKESGFTLLTYVDCKSLNTPDYNSWTVYYVAQKIKDI